MKVFFWFWSCDQSRVYYSVYIIQCILFSVYYSVYIIPCILFSVYYSVYIIPSRFSSLSTFRSCLLMCWCCGGGVAWRKGNRGQGRGRRGEKSGPTFSLRSVSFSAAVCNIQYWGITYSKLLKWGDLFHQNSSLIPFSGKLLREKTFVNWWKMWFSWRKLSQIVRFCHAKGHHAPKFRRENFRK